MSEPKYMLVPGPTSHCELHGPEGALYREHMKTEGWREALASGRARWVGMR